MASLPGIGRPWHLIERPRAPFVCDVCGTTIPEHESTSFTTLPNMYYDTPPSGYMPCNRGFDPLRAGYDNVVDGSKTTMSISTSDDLHPATGARFVFEREQTDPPSYRVQVFLPAGERMATTLRWDDSRACFEPPLPPGWPADEAIKLARVLHREPQTRLVRWRGPA